MALDRARILALPDISTKEITVPETIPVWAGEKLFIRQLTRGQQDQYLKRQFGGIKMKQDRTKSQEISAAEIYGHDAWIFVKGVVDEKGEVIFVEKDIDALNAKSGEAIGWVAAQIIDFSGMSDDVKVAKGEVTEKQALAGEVKNS